MKREIESLKLEIKALKILASIAMITALALAAYVDATR